MILMQIQSFHLENVKCAVEEKMFGPLVKNCEILVCCDHCICIEEISSCSEHGKVLRKKQKLARSGTAQKTTRNAPTVTVENKSPENSCDKRKDFDEQGQEENGISGEAMDQRQKSERKRKSKLQREEEIKKQKTGREKKKKGPTVSKVDAEVAADAKLSVVKLFHRRSRFR
ncbi:hypothetical protein ElyMa_004083100 [Elysia marginata]|uniref:Uncharacterized protein n=1 Tax=Elysia marginata TaxID=1093978 RepID=A0AAV4GB67_9GAST|nr:hypothetical protein ElyMa_004083100 [Elysia marginata]